MHRRMTGWILIGVTALLIIWDIYAYVCAGPSATISRVVLEWAGQHPVLPFGIGVVCGHILWPQKR